MVGTRIPKHGVAGKLAVNHAIGGIAQGLEVLLRANDERLNPDVLPAIRNLFGVMLGRKSELTFRELKCLTQLAEPDDDAPGRGAVAKPGNIYAYQIVCAFIAERIGQLPKEQLYWRAQGVIERMIANYPSKFKKCVKTTGEGLGRRMRVNDADLFSELVKASYAEQVYGKAEPAEEYSEEPVAQRRGRQESERPLASEILRRFLTDRTRLKGKALAGKIYYLGRRIREHASDAELKRCTEMIQRTPESAGDKTYKKMSVTDTKGFYQFLERFCEPVSHQRQGEEAFESKPGKKSLPERRAAGRTAADDKYVSASNIVGVYIAEREGLSGKKLSNRSLQLVRELELRCASEFEKCVEITGEGRGRQKKESN